MKQAARTPRRAARRSRRAVLKAGLGSAAMWSVRGALAAPAGAGAAPGGRRGPNVLLIMTDQQHIATVSARGCKHLRTPGMDALCRDGVTCLQSYTTNPVCSPARSSLWTGRMPTEAGVYQNNLPIHKSVPNIGQWFAEHTRHETVYAGKWHLPGSFTHNIPGFAVLTPGVSNQGNLGDISTSMACEAYLQNRSKDRPFLMVASFFQPHDVCQWLRLNQADPGRLPYPELAGELPELPANFEFDRNEPDAMKAKRDNDEPGANKGRWSPLHWRYYMWCYYRQVEMVDAEVARLLDALRRTGHAEDTLVVFTSDHGEGLAHHQTCRKSCLYDEAAKVPMIVSFPGHAKADAVDAEHLVSGLDVVPTVCDYVGIAPPPDCGGRSLRPLLEGRAGQGRPFLACESGTGRHCARMVRSARFKYVKYRDDPVEQLFDVQADPGETRNLAGDAAGASALADHRRMLADWQVRLKLPAPLPPEAAWPQG